MPPKTLEPGAVATVSLVVGLTDLAASWKLDESADNYPAVFSTSRMITLMEVAAARNLNPLLGPGDLSVGVDVDVRHLAATLPGDTVVATAKFVGLEGKLYKFEVKAEDSGGLIGKGTHTRAIVNNQRLMQGAWRRTGAKL